MKSASIDRQRRTLLAGAVAGLLAGVLPGRAFAQQKRVVVVGGALAETAFALGGTGMHGYQLVGTDTTCTYPEAVHRLPKVGYQRALSVEGLLSLRPDLVLASAEAGPSAVLAQIKTVGVTVTTFDEHHNVDSARAKITGVAQALGLSDKGTALLQRFEREWQAAREVVDTRPPGVAHTPRVLFVLNHTGNQALAAGRQTAAEAMIRYAGARNAMQGFDGYKPLTPEALAAAAPDVILISDEGLAAVGGRAALLAAPGFAATPAGRARRILSLNALFLLGFGPRLPLAVTTLHRQLSDALA